MSTQLESSPALTSEVGGAIGVTDGATLTLAAALGDGDCAVLADPAGVQAAAMIATMAMKGRTRLEISVTMSSCAAWREPHSTDLAGHCLSARVSFTIPVEAHEMMAQRGPPSA
ncbi:MAG: hypothetical protein ABI578_09310 [Chloroflexota bacterium]